MSKKIETQPVCDLFLCVLEKKCLEKNDRFFEDTIV